MDFGIIEVVSLLTLILTGGFSIYGMVNDFKDKEGNLTKHGRVAIYGIIISLTLSIIGFGFKLKSDSVAKTKKLEQIQQDVSRQEATLNKLESVINNIQRIGYPLTDLQIQLVYTFDSTSKSIIEFHRNTISQTLSLISKGDYDRTGHVGEIYVVGISDERQGKPTSLTMINNEESELFPRIFIPYLNLGLFDSNQETDSLNFSNRNDFSAIFPTPEDIMDERLRYNVDSGVYQYSISYIPSPQFTTSSIISHLDLKFASIGLGNLLAHDQKKWELESVTFRNSLGLTNKFKIFKSTGKQLPELSFIGKIE